MIDYRLHPLMKFVAGHGFSFEQLMKAARCAGFSDRFTIDRAMNVVEPVKSQISKFHLEGPARLFRWNAETCFVVVTSYRSFGEERTALRVGRARNEIYADTGGPRMPSARPSVNSRENRVEPPEPPEPSRRFVRPRAQVRDRGISR